MERAALGLYRQGGPGLTILRIGNIAGLDALLGRVQAGVTTQLDRVDGRVGGPVRSYIGPKTLGSVLAQLSVMAARGQSLPKILNVAAAPPVSMADLLDAAGADWAYREPGPDLIPRVELDTTLLRSLIDIPTSAGQAAQMVAEWRGLAK
jgi:hypothetical protein